MDGGWMLDGGSQGTALFVSVGAGVWRLVAVQQHHSLKLTHRDLDSRVLVSGSRNININTPH